MRSNFSMSNWIQTYHYKKSEHWRVYTFATYQEVKHKCWTLINNHDELVDAQKKKKFFFSTIQCIIISKERTKNVLVNDAEHRSQVYDYYLSMTSCLCICNVWKNIYCVHFYFIKASKHVMHIGKNNVQNLFFFLTILTKYEEQKLN